MLIGFRKKLILAALGCGLAAGVLLSLGVTALLQMNAEPEEQEPLICQQLLVLSQNVEEGTKIQERMLEYKDVWVKQSMDNLTKSTEVVGKTARTDLRKGTVILPEMVREQENIPTDMRLHKFDCVKLNEKIQKGALTDIRIRFATGADYVVLAGKKIQERITADQERGIADAVWIQVTEEELLRMSSAEVDMERYPDCEIYAILYQDGEQLEAIVNYPVNDTVDRLLEEDPNIAEFAENYQKNTLERNDLELKDEYLQHTLDLPEEENQETTELPSYFD